MRDKLIYFLQTYGSNFFSKLSHYKTATYKGEYVAILNFDSQNLLVLVRYQGQICHVDLFDLDDFVL